MQFRIEAHLIKTAQLDKSELEGGLSMKRKAVFAALFLCPLILVAGCQPAGVETNRSAVATPTAEVVNTAAIETELLRIENDWPRVIREKDTAAAGRVMADDVVLIYPDGNVGGKGTDLKAIGAGAVAAESIERADLKVHGADNDSAHGTARTVRTQAQYDPTDGPATNISGHYRFVDTFAKRTGEWKPVAGASVPARQPPAGSPSPAPATSPAASPATKPSPAATRSPAASPSPAATR